MILVTGGTGLLGTYLLYELTSKGEKVRALLRPGTRRDDIQKIFSCFEDSSSRYPLIEWVEGDVLDFYSLHTALQGIEQVYHCAALVSFDPRDNKSMLRTNVEGTANLVNACLQQGVKKMVHVSSIASLGRPEQEGIIDENSRWKTSKKNSGYAISKYGGEREVWRGIEEGLDAVIVNPSVILGAGCLPKATNPLFLGIEKMLPFYNEGINGYVDVRDVSHSMILLMESSISGERFVLSSENLSVREFFSIAASLLQKKPPFIPLNKPVFSILWRLEWIRSRITGKRALLTRENARSAQAKSSYSSGKFNDRFNFTFIPVKQSLEYAFRLMRKI